MKLKPALTLVLFMAVLTTPALADARKPSSNEPNAGTLWTEPKTGMIFSWLPSGCFQMGGDGDKDEQPVHKVCVKGFWMGRYEVTQSQYQQVMGKNPSHFGGSNHPVENVSWDDASSFAEEMSYSTGTKVRLPSEAEWEYACRAGGVHEKFCGGGGRLERMAWFSDNSSSPVNPSGETHPVGALSSNDWDLYDMSGNVWEWVADEYHDSYKGAPTDGSVWKGGGNGKRVLRGGSWSSVAQNARAAIRYGIGPVIRNEYSGFRLARTLP